MFKKGKNKLVAVLIIMLVVLSFSGCAKNSANAGSSNNEAKNVESAVDKIKKSGKLVLGTSADYPPYEFHKEINGKDEIVGFDIEIAKEIAKDLGVELEIKDMKFDGLLAALQAGKIDLVIAGMTPTEERKKSVDFSNIYYKAEQAVIVRAEDKDKYKTTDDLKGKKIGVQKGTTQEQIAKDEIQNAQLKSLGKVTDLVLELQNKKVDALVVEHPVATSYVSKNAGMVISDVKFKDQDKGSAVAIKKGSTDLVNAVNKTLERLNNEKLIDKFVIDANNMVE
ncbi:ABC transporter substrate-binding protein [Fonticella tunisiensis]|uniref:Amino acid ABC transporter substrate-binding protein (PAAT family) n=1 Tax=Fonticella tunisiensis TaxID=1096341 RepID=A0A4R7K415_9CLOT|nr:ABC transporter substrate-binding protein [Fonticella tunisiensis]TDT45650.1 amino acid ABC transporter substrate-binding protein (PAAT family) [Fonticella tunisiensis]